MRSKPTCTMPFLGCFDLSVAHVTAISRPKKGTACIIASHQSLEYKELRAALTTGSHHSASAYLSVLARSVYLKPACQPDIYITSGLRDMSADALPASSRLGTKEQSASALLSAHYGVKITPLMLRSQLPPSLLSWDSVYEREVTTFKDIGDEGEVWCADLLIQTMARMIFASQEQRS